MSLEVAEHIEEQYADIFIDNLCEASDVILFSAAIPLMGGTHHVNEQYPSYWIEKFSKKGYKPLDCLRPRYWNNVNILPCYKQDMMLYIKEENYDKIRELLPCNEHIYDIVHPEKFVEAKQVDKLINRAFLMKHLPENLFLLFKKIYLIFHKKVW